jgi:hypothetical protein
MLCDGHIESNFKLQLSAASLDAAIAFQSSHFTWHTPSKSISTVLEYVFTSMFSLF